MLLLEQTPDKLLTVDQVGQQSYGELLMNTHEIAEELDLDRGTVDKTFILLEDLRCHDEDAAIGSLRTMPLAFEIADEIGNFYGIEINYTHIFSGSLLHDIGKLAIPQPLLKKSTNGGDWLWSDIQTMQWHVIAGGQILRVLGFDAAVYRGAEESHQRQLGSEEYGIHPDLANDERINRDAIALADYAEAAINRTNSRNRHLSREERDEQIASNVVYVVGDYTERDELAHRITKKVLGKTFQNNFHQLAA